MKIKSMKAAILVKQNQPLVVDQIRLPQSLAYGQVLVKVFFSGICGSQIGEINGVKGEDPYIPHLLGHEGSGEVVETGQGVKSVNNGDKVVMHWKVGEGIDSSVPNYTWKGEKLNKFRNLVRQRKNSCFCWYNCNGTINCYLQKTVGKFDRN